MRTFINVTKNSSQTIPGTTFSNEDFHGEKRDKRNKVPKIHSIDESLPKIAEKVRSWIQGKLPGTVMTITSSRRTKTFNNLISSSGAKGAHVQGIAFDFVFSSTSAWCLLKDEISTKGPFLKELLSLGLGGIGIYGKRRSKGSYFFHFDSRTEGDGLSRGQKFGEFKYGLWTLGSLDCEITEEISVEELEQARGASSNPNEGQFESFVQYIHPDEGAELTIADLLQDPLFIGKDLSPEDLLNAENEEKTNRRRLYDNLTIRQKREGNGGSSEFNDGGNYLVTPGAILFIPLDKISIGVDYESNFTVTKTEFNEFFPPLVKRLTLDPGYIPAKNARGEQAQSINPQLRIVIWSRAKYLESNRQTGFIDVTKDILTADCNNTIDGGGDFTFTFPGIASKAQVDENTGQVVVDKCEEFGEVTKSNIHKKSTFNVQGETFDELKRIPPYYQRMFQKNDLVFIAFEKLNIDGRATPEVEGKWYDMIGLIDHIETSYSGGTELSVVIRGRSLVSVLMDDHSYFNPVSLGHQSSIYGGDPISNGRYLDSGFYELSSTLAKSIQDRMEFIFHRISTVGYVPDDVFSLFQNKTTISKYTKNTEDGTVEEERIVKGVWQIMSLFIDQSVSDLRLADSSLSNPDGTILELIKKTCQDPFVEFFTDTYGDKFYLIARKPPFELESINEVLEGISEDEGDDGSSNNQDIIAPNEGGNTNIYLESQQEVNNNELVYNLGNLDEAVIRTTAFPRIINIGEKDVISEGLRMSSRGYAWFDLSEQGNYLGANMGVGLIPSIYFDELAQVFGNRRLSVTSNYTSLTFYLDGNVEANRNLYGEQTSQQLAFLIETNIYLPFSREGQITINPDRRIKIGNWIYYRPTGEIFYVTGVSNSASISNDTIDRTTTITVERGMKRKFINGSVETIRTPQGEDKEIEVSYFNIVDIPKLRDRIYDVVSRKEATGKADHKGSVQLNTDVLDYFLQNRQFDE